MKKQSAVRTLVLIGVFALMALSLSSCVYSSRPVRYYERPHYAHRHHVRVQPRVVVVPRHDKHHRHDRHYRNDRKHNNNGRNHRGRY